MCLIRRRKLTFPLKHKTCKLLVVLVSSSFARYSLSAAHFLIRIIKQLQCEVDASSVQVEIYASLQLMLFIFQDGRASIQQSVLLAATSIHARPGMSTRNM